jgi:hypothetical protein
MLRRPVVHARTAGAIAIAILLVSAAVAMAHGIGDPRLDREQYKQEASAITANYTKDNDFAAEITDEKQECQQFTGTTSEARNAWTQTMHSQADSLDSIKSGWDTYKTWASQLAPSADLYSKSRDVRTASRKIVVGIGFDQDADGFMSTQSHAYGTFSCGVTNPLDEAKRDLAKGKQNITAGLAALKTAVDAG